MQRGKQKPCHAYFDPPNTPVLHDKTRPESFLAKDAMVTKTQKIQLMVEFPTQPQASKPNNVTMYFKQLMTLLFAVDQTMVLLNWDDPSQNPVTKIIDIKGNKEELSHYFLGMRVLSNSKKITGFIKISTEQPFWKTKQDDRVFTWLQRNRVFIRQTILSQNRHANIGWLLYLHPEYTHQRLAISDLRLRMKTRTLEFELVPHTISHHTKDNVQIKTRALKVRSNYDNREKC